MYLTRNIPFSDTWINLLHIQFPKFSRPSFVAPFGSILVKFLSYVGQKMMVIYTQVVSAVFPASEAVRCSIISEYLLNFSFQIRHLAFQVNKHFKLPRVNGVTMNFPGPVDLLERHWLIWWVMIRAQIGMLESQSSIQSSLWVIYQHFP